MLDRLPPTVSFTDVSFSQGENLIFKKINFTIAKGKITVVMGPSGTGKTTLIRLMTGQISPNEGVIAVLGQALDQLSHSALRLMRKKMGVLFQQGGLFSDLNVFDNIAFPLRQHTNLPEIMIRDLVFLMLNAVGLTETASLRVEQLSGGMMRRVAMARAIVMSPEMIFYDEPFAGQDPITKSVLLKLICHLHQVLQTTTVVVSHDVAESLTMADQIIMLSDGEIIASGTPEEVRSSTDVKVVRFLQGNTDGSMASKASRAILNKELL